MVLQIDAARIKPGLRGNLLVNAFAVVKSQERGKKSFRVDRRGQPLGMLSAIPFEVVPGEPAAKETAKAPTQ